MVISLYILTTHADWFEQFMDTSQQIGTPDFSVISSTFETSYCPERRCPSKNGVYSKMEGSAPKGEIFSFKGLTPLIWMIKKDFPTTEVLCILSLFIADTGNSLEYWGHLTAGLADLLCSYCTQQGFTNCIERHCNRSA